MKTRSLLVFLSAAAASLVFAASQATAAVADAAPTKSSSPDFEVTGGTGNGGDTDEYHHGGWDRYSPKYCFHNCGFDYDYYLQEHDWDWEAKGAEDVGEGGLQKRGPEEDDLKVKNRGDNEQNYDKDSKHRDHNYDGYRWCKYREHRHSSHSYHDEGDGGKKGW